MKQLTQKLKSGKTRILEVPLPLLAKGQVLVRSCYSVISAGTEGATVRAARKGLIGKARERPQQVSQTIELLRQQGPVQAYRGVMKRLDVWSPLGYSAAGEVIAVAADVSEFAVGDAVACAGSGHANHAEVLAVPVSLCVKLGPGADLKAAAYNTLGAVALQGIRQADLRLGESCAVIGLGLIGQLTGLLLKAAGIRVAGIDIDSWAVQMANDHGWDIALRRDAAGISERIREFSGGIGVDAVIIAAASTSNDPINFAGDLARQKGRVVIVGDVPTGFDREPFYYRKELDVRMSCSYGPGRYDPSYEEKGIDYPAGWVRWTEKRNMEAFQELIRSGKIAIDHLTTRVFKLDEAPAAYDLILQKKEHYLGLLIEYDAKRPLGESRIVVNQTSRPLTEVSVAFIGAGSYAQSHLLPHLDKLKKVRLQGVIGSTGTGSRSAAERYEFAFCTGDERDILENDGINTVFIATRHDSHAEYVKKALAAHKHVFVEKPLCISEKELDEIAFLYSSLVARHMSPLLMAGFNRRFAPLARLLKAKLGPGPAAMIYRVNAGAIPKEHWVQDPESGGGRIIGEVCHYIDFLTFVCGSLPVSVFAEALPDPRHIPDTLNVNLCFADGSIGAISYLANGGKSLFKEYIEVYRAGTTAVLTDFKKLEIFAKTKIFKKKLFSQDKGQETMINAFVDAVAGGGPAPIDFNEIRRTTLATCKIGEALRTGQKVLLS